MKSSSKRNILIGLTVIVSICLLIWGIEYLKGANLFKPTNYYYAKFEKVDGLNISAPVKVNGFQVGLVKDIEYDYEHNKIVVEMSFDKEMRIPKGSTVTMNTELLGSANLVLTLGTGNAYLQPGDYIPASIQTGLMDNVRSDVMPSVMALIPKVDSILSGANMLISNPAIGKSVTRFDEITAELSKSSQELTVLMSYINQAVPGMMNGVNGVVGNAKGLTNDLKTTTANLNELTGNLNTLPLDTALNRVNATLANMQRLTAQLNKQISALDDKNSSLGQLMHDRQLYQNAANTMASLDSLLTDFKKNPKKYVTIKVF